MDETSLEYERRLDEEGVLCWESNQHETDEWDTEEGRRRLIRGEGEESIMKEEEYLEWQRQVDDAIAESLRRDEAEKQLKEEKQRKEEKKRQVFEWVRGRRLRNVGYFDNKQREEE